VSIDPAQFGFGGVEKIDEIKKTETEEKDKPKKAKEEKKASNDIIGKWEVVDVREWFDMKAEDFLPAYGTTLEFNEDGSGFLTETGPFSSGEPLDINYEFDGETGKVIIGEGADYGPLWFEDGQLYFAPLRPLNERESAWIYDKK
jgi:hypothetical protein